MTGSCYQLVREKLNWSDAEVRCNSIDNDATLASINSHLEHKFIADYLKASGLTSPIYIGLSDIIEESRFEWTDGSPVTYTNWDDGEPNNEYHGGYEDCVVLWLGYWQENSEFLWNDYPCHYLESFVCKKK